MASRILMRNNAISTYFITCIKYSTAPKAIAAININGKEYISDDFTNVTPKIMGYLNRNLHLQENNPLSLVRQRIINYFYKNFTRRGKPSFSVYENLSPIVSTKQNFDDLLIPFDHPSRTKSDCYYVNKDVMFRAHMTAHQRELLKTGLDNFIVIGDVYRRDEIDSTHFPVFHQVDVVRSQRKEQLFPNKPDLQIFEPTFDENNQNSVKNSIDDPTKQSCHTLEATKLMEVQLKNDLIGLVKVLFGDNVKHRWVDAYFPFTHPSWELEIYYENNWMEVLGCGIVRNEILASVGPNNTIAYAFGLGLERLAMALYKIPDIRLMWSEDSGFLSQFENKNVNAQITYKPVSLYPQCCNDISFWLPENLTIDSFVNNDFYDLVRDVGGDIVEQVKLKDKFVHPKTKKHSLCYSIVYRHLERTLNQAEVNEVHANIAQAAVNAFNVTTEKKDNAPKVVPELEKYRSRIIRSTARLIREKKTPDEIWQIMKDEFGRDYETLWNRMRANTIKKLNRLIAADDGLKNISPISRLTTTDWLLFDLVLVHEDIDVIGQKKTQEAGAEYKPMVDLFSLVQKFEIEDHIVSENYEELPKAWALATLHYNKGGRMCSSMLLQKRWFQVKEVTRAKFYGFWKLYGGNLNNLKTAKLFAPTKLQTAIAKRFQHLLTKNSIPWKEAYEIKAIVSPEELTLMMDNSAGLRNSLDGDDNAPDIVLLEPVIETVTLDSDSESESKDKPSTSKDEITTKSETLQINIKKNVTEYTEDFQIDEVDNTRIEGTYQKNHYSDNEEDKKLNFEKFNVTVQIFDETSSSTTQIDNYLQISDTITQESDEILRSYDIIDSTPQILNVISLGKSSSHENVNKIGSLITPEDEKIHTKMTSDDEEAKDVIITMPRMHYVDNEKVHNSVELNTEVPANVDFSRDVIGFANDDIEFVDDGTDERGNEEKSGEQKAKDVDIEMKIDPKLPMTVEAKLDDMFVLKGNSIQNIKDSRMINSALVQNKPVGVLKENVGSIQTPIETTFKQKKYQSKVDIDDINENFKVSYSSKLLKKPSSLKYNPIQLCKNPDFNTSLKRLTRGFFSSTRNRRQYKVCKPVTIDVSKAFESKLIDGTLYLKNNSFREQPRPIYTNIDESLLTLDTVDKMLSILSSDVHDSKDTSKSRKKSKATRANTSNKTKIIPPIRKPQKRDFNKYCCWIRKKIGNPFLTNRYHLCLPNNCNCCCKSCVLTSIEDYKKMNEPDAVMELTAFFRQFQRKYGGPLEGVVSDTPTVNNSLCKSPVINVDQGETHPISKNVIPHDIGINDLVLDVPSISDSLSVTADNNDFIVPQIFGECHFVNSKPVLVDEKTKCITVSNTITSNISSHFDESRKNLIKRCYINKKRIQTNM